MCKIIYMKYNKVSYNISLSILDFFSLDPFVRASRHLHMGLSHHCNSTFHDSYSCLRLEHKPKSAFSFSFPCLRKWNHQLLKKMSIILICPFPPNITSERCLSYLPTSVSKPSSKPCHVLISHR